LSTRGKEGKNAEKSGPLMPSGKKAGKNGAVVKKGKKGERGKPKQGHGVPALEERPMLE